jgi:ornithine cyclodeaminase/alanine dehydrogenase
MTKTPEPQIKDEWLHAGQTIVLTDAHFMFEDTTFAHADKYLTDCLAQYEIKSRYYSCAPTIYAENGTVFSGRLPGRENDKELIVCNNLGMAVTDLLVARYMFDAALEAGAGMLLDL